MAGDTVEALERGRRLVALDRERGSLTGTYAAISTGNLIDAELAAGDAQGAVRSGAQLVEWLRGTELLLSSFTHVDSFYRTKLLFFSYFWGYAKE
jgi:hypothetical protein